MYDEIFVLKAVATEKGNESHKTRLMNISTICSSELNVEARQREILCVKDS